MTCHFSDDSKGDLLLYARRSPSCSGLSTLAKASSWAGLHSPLARIARSSEYGMVAQLGLSLLGFIQGLRLVGLALKLVVGLAFLRSGEASQGERQCTFLDTVVM